MQQSSVEESILSQELCARKSKLIAIPGYKKPSKSIDSNAIMQDIKFMPLFLAVLQERGALQLLDVNKYEQNCFSRVQELLLLSMTQKHERCEREGL